MPEVQSAISQVSPGRGRRPVILKGGTPLAEARKNAQTALVAAKAAYRIARAEHIDTTRQVKAATSRHGAAAKHLEKVKRQRFATTKDKRAAISAASATAKAAAADLKAAKAAESITFKAMDKVVAVVTKAETEKLRVEEKYQASKTS
jgi:hypothetical protein